MGDWTFEITRAGAVSEERVRVRRGQLTNVYCLTIRELAPNGRLVDKIIPGVDAQAVLLACVACAPDESVTVTSSGTQYVVRNVGGHITVQAHGPAQRHITIQVQGLVEGDIPVAAHELEGLIVEEPVEGLMTVQVPDKSIDRVSFFTSMKVPDIFECNARPQFERVISNDHPMPRNRPHPWAIAPSESAGDSGSEADGGTD